MCNHCGNKLKTHTRTKQNQASKANKSQQTTMDKQLLEAYVRQLTSGCGVKECSNEQCRKFSNPETSKKSLAVAIVMQAHGPQQLCFNDRISTLATMMESADECRLVGWLVGWLFLSACAPSPPTGRVDWLVELQQRLIS